MDDPQTVFVVDDDNEVREALAAIIEAVGYRPKICTSAEDFLAVVTPDTEGCAILDIEMPGMSGLELQTLMARRGIALPTIVMTGHADVPRAVQALKNGAVDFVEKPCSAEALLDSVRRALGQGRARRKKASAQRRARDLMGLLTPRESDVARLLADGLNNKEIARELDISPRTVEVHRGRVMDKFDVPSLPGVVRIVIDAED